MQFVELPCIVPVTPESRKEAYNVVCAKLPKILMRHIFLRKSWEKRTSVEYVFEAYIFTPREINHIVELIQSGKLMEAQSELSGISSYVPSD